MLQEDAPPGFLNRASPTEPPRAALAVPGVQLAAALLGRAQASGCSHLLSTPSTEPPAALLGRGLFTHPTSIHTSVHSWHYTSERLIRSEASTPETDSRRGWRRWRRQPPSPPRAAAQTAIHPSTLQRTDEVGQQRTPERGVRAAPPPPADGHGCDTWSPRFLVPVPLAPPPAT